jgi:hypothetical protein
MLLVIGHPPPPENLQRSVAFKLYAVELKLNTQRCKLIPVNSLGDSGAVSQWRPMPICFGQVPPFLEQQLHLLQPKSGPHYDAFAEDWFVRALGGVLPNT